MMTVFPLHLVLLQFEREKKQKGESPGGVEEVLASVTRSEFGDEQLARLCGLQWADFVELTDLDKRGVVFWLSNHHRQQQQLATAAAAAKKAAEEERKKSREEIEEDEEDEDEVAELLDLRLVDMF